MTHAPLPDPSEEPAPSAPGVPAGTVGDPVTGPGEGEHGSSRRTFLAGTGAATVLGAAVATGAGALTVGAAAASRPDEGPDTRSAGAHGDGVVAYLRDPTRGEVRLLSGEREVVVHDPGLARTLTRHLADHADGQER
jgi:hypothetical protein